MVEGVSVSNKNIGSGSLLVIWAGALAIAFMAFYGLDHFIMGIQGLPLNLDLTPAQ